MKCIKKYKICNQILTMKEEIRDIKLDIILGKYKAISAYEIPKDVEKWLNCPNCGLKPLVWEFNNGRATACGCGENQYRHFAIHAESIMSWIKRHDGSALDYDCYELRKNWNHWVETGEEFTHEKLRILERW
jgi:hypothetical protein